nr:uncharacterized protein LOC109422363 [Aedes albopictus]
MMDYFAYLIANKATAAKTVKIRKTYINEDPSQEETAPCPSCMERNQSSSVRYMYVNLQEAIYKCESPSCMYPFQNFKFKNYTDNTVYSYTSAEETLSATPEALVDFGQSFTNVAPSSPGRCKTEDAAPGSAMNDSATIDFSFSFFSPDRSPKNNSISKIGHNTSLNIFGSPSLSYKNLVQEFDTGFIDDILQDLNQSTPQEQPKPVLVSPVRSVVESKAGTAGRQLKRCLQMLEDNTASSNEATFKVPPLPGTEVSSPPKIKPKKHSPLRRSKHNKRTYISSGSLSLEKMAKKRSLKPLEFIETVNSLQPKKATPAESNLPGVKPLKNRRVENMLNFIERSLKNRQPKPLETVPPSPPKQSAAKRSPGSHRKSNKHYKRMSLSAAVLHDSQFEYSTSESEQEDVPPPPPPSKIRIPSPLKLEDFNGDTSLESFASSPEHSSQSSLPSFEDLLSHIHPDAEPKRSIISPVGFRSAGCSPTREPQWAQTPPRRIHSMESLCGLLE